MHFILDQLAPVVHLPGHDRRRRHRRLEAEGAQLADLPAGAQRLALGLCHDFGLAAERAPAPAASAPAWRARPSGFVLLFPVYAIGGMGAGDVKMQMGFGAWIGALRHQRHRLAPRRLWIVFWAFCAAAIIGGVLAMGMMLIRGKLQTNMSFGTADASGDAGGDVSFAVLHGLYWLTVNLSAERPLLLAVDDLQWCDHPSLRFLAYLARRLDGLPVLVACGVRSSEPESTPPCSASSLPSRSPSRSSRAR